MRIRLVAFDVNETLLDVSALAPMVTDLLGPDASLGEWFARMVHRSVVANHLGLYQPFGDLGAEALVWMAERAGVDLDLPTAREAMVRMTLLPPHPDVVPGLEALAATGVPLVALTNGSAEMATLQMSHAGLGRYLEEILSVEAVGLFKPARQVYAYAATAMAVDIGEMLLVAAHDWDVAGAQAAGGRGCFVRRQPWGLTRVAPDLAVDDLTQLPALLEEEE